MRMHCYAFLIDKSLLTDSLKTHLIVIEVFAMFFIAYMRTLHIYTMPGFYFSTSINLYVFTCTYVKTNNPYTALHKFLALG